jgi:hypothetical protein
VSPHDVPLPAQQRTLLDEFRHTRGSPIPIERLTYALYGSRYDGGPDCAHSMTRKILERLRRSIGVRGISILTIGYGRGTQGYMLDPEHLDRVEAFLQEQTGVLIEAARARAAVR